MQIHVGDNVHQLFPYVHVDSPLGIDWINGVLSLFAGRCKSYSVVIDQFIDLYVHRNFDNVLFYCNRKTGERNDH